jgi:hypothetical protein
MILIGVRDGFIMRLIAHWLQQCSG